MRILFLSHYFPPEVNAPATRTYDHCRRWVKAGHDVTVLTSNPNCPTGTIFSGYRNRLRPQVEMVDGIRVVRVWTFLAANRGKRRRSLNFLTYMVSAMIVGMAQKRPDVLIATSPQFFCGLAGMFLGWVRRIPRVLEIRDIWPASIIAVEAVRSRSILGLLVGLERLMYRMATHIVAVGSGYRDHILERTQGEREISVITNGVDLDKLAPSPVCQPSFFGPVIADKFVCSYVGTIGLAHGLEVVLDAAALLKQKGRSDIHFALVGDGAMRAQLEQRATEMGLTDGVSFCGLIDKSRVKSAYESSDAMLIHLKENDLFSTVIPSKLFEAMAMNVPVVLGVKGEAQEILRAANCGVAVEPENAAQLGNAVALLADDAALRASLAANGRHFVGAHYDRDVLADDFLDLLHEVTGIQRLKREHRDVPPRGRQKPRAKKTPQKT